MVERVTVNLSMRSLQRLKSTLNDVVVIVSSPRCSPPSLASRNVALKVPSYVLGVYMIQPVPQPVGNAQISLVLGEPRFSIQSAKLHWVKVRLVPGKREGSRLTFHLDRSYLVMRRRVQEICT